MNKSGITPTQLVVRIVIIIIVLIVLLLVSFSMIKLIPKVFTSISDLKNLIHTNATSTVATSTHSNPATTTTQQSQPAPTQNVSSSTTKSISVNLVTTFTTSHITNNRGTITFRVTNAGTKNSGIWKFSAVLPRSSGTQNYNSPNQTNIPPGKTSTFTLTFDNAKKGTATITINGTTFTTQVN